MENKVDIVIQGNLWDCTIQAATRYADLDFVNKVYISTWKEERKRTQSYPPNNKIHYVFSELPSHEGGNNVNYQIVSSKNGILASDCEVVVKMRSDQIVSTKSMYDMYNFRNEFMERKSSLTMDPKPQEHLFTLGVGTHYPYHPQDHILWGHREDLLNFFSLPLSPFPSLGPIDPFKTTLRANIYLGVHYFSKYDKDAQKHIDKPELYLLDEAPKFKESMITSEKIIHKLFKAFPKIDLYWEKYKSGYLYDFYKKQGECYDE